MDLWLDIINKTENLLDDWILVALNVAIHLLDLLSGVNVNLGGDTFARSHMLKGDEKIKTGFVATRIRM